MFKWKLLAAIVVISQLTARTAPEPPNEFVAPGEVWLDTDGKTINAHGGGMLFRDGTYYWFGEVKDTGASACTGISCYASNNLLDWKNEGIALAVVNRHESENRPGCIMERPKVIYNEKTGKYVMWFHLELKSKGYSAAPAGRRMRRICSLPIPSWVSGLIWATPASARMPI